MRRVTRLRRRGRAPGRNALSVAERDVLAQFRRGRSDIEIARRMQASLPVVRAHVAGMLVKLDLPDRAALVASRPDPRPQPEFPAAIGPPLIDLDVIREELKLRTGAAGADLP